MLTAKFIFITITLILLVLIAIKMKVPKTSFPLFIIYLIFVITNLPKTSTKDEKLDSSFIAKSKDVNSFLSEDKRIVTNENKKMLNLNHWFSRLKRTNQIILIKIKTYLIPRVIRQKPTELMKILH